MTSKLPGALMSIVYSLLLNFFLIAVAIIGIGFLIAFHEFGHFIFCKIFNVKTPSFSIGFGPRIIEKKIGETTFALSAIPLGGYVEIAGSHEPGQGEQKDAFSKDPRSFAQKPYYQKMLIIAGGILFNLIFAWGALSSLFYFGGPCLGNWCKDQKPVVLSVQENLPAQKAGLKAYDTIIAINDNKVSSIKDVARIINEKAGQTIDMTIKREGQIRDSSLSIKEREVQGKKIGVIGAFWYLPPHDFISSIKQGYRSTVIIVKDIFLAFKSMVTRGSAEGVGGPLMLINEVKKSASMGFQVFLFILALISINLAVFNVLPFPIFDGGQALLITIETLKGKPLSDGTRESIAYYTWIGVIILVVLLTTRDAFMIFFR
jgi:regulator of sigma E protease